MSLRVTLACLLGGLLLWIGTAGSALAGPGPAGGERRVEAYRLGPGDKLRVTTFGEDSLTGRFDVSAAGAVSMPLIGEVRAQGLTTTELQQRIEAALRDGYLKAPNVSVEVLSYRPFYILGEVQKPGEYPYTSGLTVMNAVATANGFTYRANTRRVRIRRAGEAGEREYPLTTTTPVAPGDTIRIRERLF